MALYTSRMIPIFAIVVAPIAAKAMADWLRADYSKSHFFKLEENVYRINSTSNGLIWISAIILLTALLLKSGRTLDSQAQGNVFDKRFFPVSAVSWLENHPQTGHMFNEFDWGGYLLLNLWPNQQIFMDGHTHIYGEVLTREYERVITLGNGWVEILNKYDVKWIIIRTHTSLANQLASSPNWKTAYKDKTAIIFVRK